MYEEELPSDTATRPGRNTSQARAAAKLSIRPWKTGSPRRQPGRGGCGRGH